ncbi:MAG: hypothetical protein PHQ43_03745 [Dehalococcoidales bacterium]|nr:hypothetical protein [Dehalococcoidales bacterium]
MKMILANGNTVEVTELETKEFITEIATPIPNAYWKHSGLLNQAEVLRFLKGASSPDELKKVARYLLIYTENLAFSAYLFNKANGGDPDGPKDFTMPAIRKLRELYRNVLSSQPTEPVSHNVKDMLNVCRKIGIDPL